MQALRSSDAIITLFLWDPPVGSTKKYKKTLKRLAAFSSRSIRPFEIIFFMQNSSSNLSGQYCLSMAHFLNEIHFAENVSTFFCEGRKNFTSKIQHFANRLLSKLTTVSAIDIVRYFNIHCKGTFGYKVCYTQSNYDA